MEVAFGGYICRFNSVMKDAGSTSLMTTLKWCCIEEIERHVSIWKNHDLDPLSTK
jgi:hypothetical protein